MQKKYSHVAFGSYISNFKHEINPDESCNRGFVKWEVLLKQRYYDSRICCKVL